MEEIKRKKEKKIRGRQPLIDTKAKAYELFIQTQWTQKDIAESVGVSEQTLGIWKNEGDWEGIKTDLEVGSTNIRRTLAEQYRKILLGEKPSVNLKDLELIMEMMLKLDSIVNTKSCSAVFSSFNNFLVYEQEVDADILVRITNLQQLFIEFLIQNPIR